MLLPTDQGQYQCYPASPCQNEAVCFEKPPADYRCECPEGLTGKNCEGRCHLRYMINMRILDQFYRGGVGEEGTQCVLKEMCISKNVLVCLGLQTNRIYFISLQIKWTFILLRGFSSQRELIHSYPQSHDSFSQHYAQLESWRRLKGSRLWEREWNRPDPSSFGLKLSKTFVVDGFDPLQAQLKN